MFRVAKVMRAKDDPQRGRDETCWELIEDGIYIDGNATLEAAMPIFDRSGVPFIPVVTLAGEGQAT